MPCIAVGSILAVPVVGAEVVADTALPAVLRIAWWYCFALAATLAARSVYGGTRGSAGGARRTLSRSVPALVAAGTLAALTTVEAAYTHTWTFGIR